MTRLSRTIVYVSQFLVLSFLEGIEREGSDVSNTPPRSLVDPNEFPRKPGSALSGARSQLYSPAPRSKASETLLNNGGMFSPRKEFKGADLIQEVVDDDAESNVQEGVQTEIGEEMVAVRSKIAICLPILPTDT